VGEVIPFKRNRKLYVDEDEGEIVLHCANDIAPGRTCGSHEFILYPDGTPACAACGARPLIPDSKG
jgi:hypothetical protein